MPPKMFRPPTLLRSQGPIHLSSRHLAPRTFSTTTPSLSALFNLNGLAQSRESQFLSKERGIPRTEYSSNIHLIRSSEVDPFPNAPGASKHPEASRRASSSSSSSSSQKRGGRQAWILPSADGRASNETLPRNANGISYLAQQRAIDELKIQLMALMDENARLRAAARESKTPAPVSVSREVFRVVVFLVGSYGLIAFFWPAAFQKDISKEQDVKKEAESAAVAPIVQIEPAAAAYPIKPSSDSEAVLTSQEELSGQQRSRNSRNPLRFLWA
ncbi:hypothetical protein N0V82_009542 [Gnomoniopsis sp. IMI 355080]|nr:hypothetical protein N0V82_009542 [Gnomoniopsis sp. IMI 355080]